MIRVALYARYSSDNQRDASIEDQLRQCRERAAREGWTVVETYSDRAISGASLIRSGIQSLLADAQAGRFDMVLSEALDRISRDQEDVAGVFKRLRFAGVTIFTLSEGEINELHVGLKGTMNALFLKDLAIKTHRGIRGRVEAGKIGGGNAYGYRVVHQLDARGEPIRGEREIIEEQAEVVRRIFREYVAGKGPQRIAADLNRDGIPSPTGKRWGDTVIRGNREIGSGILNCELYIGRLVWNRQRKVKNPDTGRYAYRRKSGKRMGVWRSAGTADHPAGTLGRRQGPAVPFSKPVRRADREHARRHEDTGGEERRPQRHPPPAHPAFRPVVLRLLRRHLPEARPRPLCLHQPCARERLRQWPHRPARGAGRARPDRPARAHDDAGHDGGSHARLCRGNQPAQPGASGHGRDDPHRACRDGQGHCGDRARHRTGRLASRPVRPSDRA
ncbi:DNA invertase Pin-like site-specific DNA recombinase [Caldimonas thermodepolymerans]|nr:DNA invertase Pin-like site-specific DNA recombinase [Caldimonas thermodepolymerans]